MTGRELWELYNSYGEVYSQPLNEEVEELDEVTGRGYIEPVTGRHTKYSEVNRSQKPGSPAMRLGFTSTVPGSGRTPYSKNRTKAQYVQSLPNTPQNRKRLRDLNKGERVMIDRYRTSQQAAHAAAHQERQKWQDSVEYDLYDLVLEYLLDQGLCESVENAEIMMAHMSEQWIDSIIEEGMEEMPHLRQAMKDALRAGNQEKVKEIAAKLSDLQPKAQTKIGAELKGLNRRKRG